jgi:uncharacterized protein YqhQ
MFKRLATSISKPPLAVFFIKDSWPRVIFYFILLPFLLVIPYQINQMITPGMSISRYELLVETISKNLIVDDVSISNYELNYENSYQASFDYYIIYIGQATINNESIGIVFNESNLSIVIRDQVAESITYEELGLESYDFSNDSAENIRYLAVTIKNYLDQNSFLSYVDFFLIYFLGVIDYLFYVSLMTILMVLIVPLIKMPISNRIKLSVYLTSVFILVELILILFNLTNLKTISIMFVYFYHIWAYKSIVNVKGALL